MGLSATLFIIFGGILFLDSLISWRDEFASGDTIPLSQGRVTAINDRAPYDNTSKPRVFVRYPVFEYRDESGIRRELTGQQAFRGYYDVGDEVPIAKIGSRVIISDAWFRSQTYICGCLLGLILLSGGIALLHRFRALT